MPVYSNTASTIFAHPKKTASTVGILTLFGLLIPTCIKLTPLGNNDRDAKGDRDHAQNDYDQTSQQLNGIYAQVSEDKQRIIDLDCAMAGYTNFNQAAIAFQQRIANSNGAPIDRLNQFWQIQFIADKSQVTQSTDRLSYDQLDYEYDYYYSCGVFDCGSNQNCCWGWGFHLVTNTYYYNQITTITNYYQNIIQGTPVNLLPLNCGYYSRTFGTTAPVNYRADESARSYSGNKESGTTYVNFNRYWGASISASYTLDGNTVHYNTAVLRTVTQDNAAADLAARLYQFLASAIAVFSVTGANYTALQDNFRHQIPILQENAAIVNNTLQEQAMVLAGKQAIYEMADDEFKSGLSLWLPLFFLLPGGMALLTYLVVVKCKDWFEQKNMTQPGLEAGQVQIDPPPPPYESPRFRS